MNPYRLILAVAAIAALAPAAGLAQPPADEVVATAQGGTGAAPPAGSSSSAIATTTPDRDDLSREGPLPDRKMHGEVTVGVGTNGYREVSGVVAGPIGQNAQMMIAVDVGSENQRRR